MSNIITSFIFIVLGIVTFQQTQDFPEYDYSIVNSATFPRIIASLMIIFSCCLIARELIRRKKQIREKVVGMPLNRIGILGMAVTVGYIFLVELMGFIIPTALVLVAYSFILCGGKFRFLDNIIIPAIGIAFVVIMFSLLNVPLMRGTLF